MTPAVLGDGDGKIKVLHFTNSLRAGGKERQLVELIKKMRHDFSCEVVSMSKDNHYPELAELGVPVHYLVRASRKDPGIFFRFYSMCKKMKPHVVHTWDSMTSVYALPAVVMTGCKLLNGMIRDAPPGLTYSDKRLIRAKTTYLFSDLVVGNSVAGLRAYRAPHHNSLCIPNGFDPERIVSLQPASAIREKYGIDTTYIVGMVATFSEKKDYATFFKACQLVLQATRDVTFFAIGEGANAENCSRYMEPSQVGHFRLLDKQKHVETLINAFDVGVLASSAIHGEGISNSLTEYMALAKPVVATHSGGNNELVIDAETGYIVPLGDAQGMAQKILHLLGDAETASRMGREGKRRVERDFCNEKMVAAYCASYHKILGFT